MELIGRVITVALCVLAAYALPSLTDVNFEDENVINLDLVSQFQTVSAAVVGPQAVNSSLESCTTKFTKEATKINHLTVNQTQSCFESAEAALEEFDDKVLSKTVVEVNALSKNLQMTLANCSAIATSIDILVCYLNIFDETMENLNNITSQSQVAVSSLNDAQYTAEVEAKWCVNKVLIASKANSSIATNDLQICLSNTTVVEGRNAVKSEKLKSRN